MPNSSELLKMLNRFTKREHTLDEVYLFDMILCDNDIDRDGECFSPEALKQLAERFVGVTGIFDHNPCSSNQTARIFRTEIRSDPDRKTQNGQVYRCLFANAYMVRTDGNADLIREIDGGIKKEVSISCSVGKHLCSICGNDKLKQPCPHVKGRMYSGAKCFHTLDEISDVYEWSFVAVPAQRAAGVTKVTKTFGAICDPEKTDLQERLDSAVMLNERLEEAVRKQVVRLCYRNGENACARMLADSTMHMNGSQLLTMLDSLSCGTAAADSAPQLAPCSEDNLSQITAFRLKGR